jgi:hypothetical protein
MDDTPDRGDAVSAWMWTGAVLIGSHSRAIAACRSDNRGKFTERPKADVAPHPRARLNVPFTRARWELVLIASIQAHDIDESRVQKSGPKVLKRYLAFAKDGCLPPETAAPTGKSESPFELAVWQELRERGFDVDRQVGVSRPHGVLAPNAKLRSKIVPAPAERATEPPTDHAPAQGETPRMSWARLLKRVFDIDIDHCPNCDGSLKIIAAIDDPPVIVKILSHLGLPSRAPPRAPARRVDLFQTI